MPSYPTEARRRGVKGTVNVFILINRQGAIERVCSTGPKELRKAAEAAAVEFRFKRPMINDGVDPFGYIQETLVFKFLPSSP
jgi:TonB family protein